jgi:hypothetical protein
MQSSPALCRTSRIRYFRPDWASFVSAPLGYTIGCAQLAIGAPAWQVSDVGAAWPQQPLGSAPPAPPVIEPFAWAALVVAQGINILKGLPCITATF